MAESDKEKVRQLLIATRFGVSASEMPIIINVEQQIGLQVIEQLKAEGEDVQSLGEGSNPPELVLYSIGEIEP
ncbi:hypothetical protein BIY21_08180 [Vibrio ponticus]|uniref:Uncharacterized protein n=1 Tax=Vibrio ponticus TaxID=265668 RepID=A0ABX3FKF6_9VIBR|nr:hypothetical protein [Vibrio ponticus]OLQ94686.1 hypothetical protein BIY21_08180 [Vibrio ponticus]